VDRSPEHRNVAQDVAEETGITVAKVAVEVKENN
jgi:hypothetical protein